MFPQPCKLFFVLKILESNIVRKMTQCNLYVDKSVRHHFIEHFQSLIFPVFSTSFLTLLDFIYPSYSLYPIFSSSQLTTYFFWIAKRPSNWCCHLHLCNSFIFHLWNREWNEFICTLTYPLPLLPFRLDCETGESCEWLVHLSLNILLFSSIFFKISLKNIALASLCPKKTKNQKRVDYFMLVLFCICSSYLL